MYLRLQIWLFWVFILDFMGVTQEWLPKNHPVQNDKNGLVFHTIWSCKISRMQTWHGPNSKGDVSYILYCPPPHWYLFHLHLYRKECWRNIPLPSRIPQNGWASHLKNVNQNGNHLPPLVSKYPVRRCLGTQNPLQNHLQKGLEHKGPYFPKKFATITFLKSPRIQSRKAALLKQSSISISSTLLHLEIWRIQNW